MKKMSATAKLCTISSIHLLKFCRFENVVEEIKKILTTSKLYTIHVLSEKNFTVLMFCWGYWRKIIIAFNKVKTFLTLTEKKTSLEIFSSDWMSVLKEFEWLNGYFLKSRKH